MPRITRTRMSVPAVALSAVALTAIAMPAVAVGDARTGFAQPYAGTPRYEHVAPTQAARNAQVNAPLGPPPGAVYIPAGLLPKGVVRKTFPTIHSGFDTKRLGLPKGLSVTSNPTTNRYLVNTTVSRWRAAGVLLLTP